MRICAVQCSLALLALTLVLCSSQPDSDLLLDLDLRHRRLLQSARNLGIPPKDWGRREVKELLSRLTLPELELEENEKPDVRLEMERSAEISNNLPPRERKAGCKNFYWKGFTSC